MISQAIRAVVAVNARASMEAPAAWSKQYVFSPRTRHFEDLTGTWYGSAQTWRLRVYNANATRRQREP
jgi:hypothetical protein